ncbi:MAG: DUF4388 domain-containing protein [Myxococcota bacterium]
MPVSDSNTTALAPLAWLAPIEREEIALAAQLEGDAQRLEVVRSAIDLHAAGAAGKAAWSLRHVADAAEGDAVRWLATTFRARAALRAGLKDDAREALAVAEARAAGLGPRVRLHAAVLAAHAAVSLGDHEAASAAARRASKLAAPGLSITLLGSLDLARARLANAEGRVEGALAMAQHALARDPQPALLFLAARALPSRGVEAALGLLAMAAEAGSWQRPAFEHRLFADLVEAETSVSDLARFLRARNAPASPEQLRALDALAEARPGAFAPAVARAELLAALDRLPEARDVVASIGEESVPMEVAARLRSLGAASASEGDARRGAALAGELGHFPFPELLSFLAAGRFTGTLRLESPDAVSARVTLHEGAITGGDRDGDAPFARALGALGWEAAATRKAPSAVLLREALAAGVDRAAAAEALRKHVVRALTPLMAWGGGRFAFEPSGSGGGAPAIRIEAQHVLLEAARREDEGHTPGGQSG